MYGKTINGVLYVSFEEMGGYKPMIKTVAPDAPEGFYASFFWNEETESFVQTWEIVADPEPEPSIEDKAEAYDILMGGAS